MLPGFRASGSTVGSLHASVSPGLPLAFGLAGLLGANAP